MWQILQNDILASADDFDVCVADWATLPMDIASVAALNNKLQRLVSGAKLNKANDFAELIKAVQNYLEQQASAQQTLDEASRAQLDKAGAMMRELATAELPAEHYQNTQSGYQSLVEQLLPQTEPENAHNEGVESICDDVLPSSPEDNNEGNAIASNPETLSIAEIFLQEVEIKCHELIDGLLKVEKGIAGLKDYEEMMRNAHSLKGGARLADLEHVVGLTHRLEDVFSLAQQGKRGFSTEDIDLLMQVVDLIPELAKCGNKAGQQEQEKNRYQQGESLLNALSSGQHVSNAVASVEISDEPDQDDSCTVSAFKDENLQNIIRMVSDMKIDSQRLLDISKSFQLFYKRFANLGHQFDNHLDHHGELVGPSNPFAEFKEPLEKLIKDSRQLFDDYEQISVNNANALGNLTREALACRMGVFGDCLLGIPRLVRDLAKKQEKLVELKIEGANTPVDRDIIKPFIPVLTHLVQNAVDHGIETPNQRVAVCKAKQATLTLKAEHRSGYLTVNICDDGRGIDLGVIKKKIIADDMVSETMVEQLSEEELLSFIFLPRFSLKQELTQVSGRGVGLDIVHSFITQAQGKVKVHNEYGKGVSFEFRLPVSLATIRCVVVDVCQEIYALPVSQIDRIIQFDPEAVFFIEGRPVIRNGEDDVYLFRADQQLGLEADSQKTPEKLIILKSPKGTFGFMVQQVLDEIELVDRPLNSGLGKLRDVRTASALPDGTPVLILDVEDLLTHMEKSLYELSSGQWQSTTDADAGQKQVLVVDDSLTVREVERNMLIAGGYRVDVAVDGVDGWNHLRAGNYDLLVTDIDMPRMNGWELLERVRNSANMASLPVIIVSYKDRQEDFERGLESGADSYVTKGSFQDDSFMETVKQLIGVGKENA